MGGPTTAIVAEELIGLGAQRLVRVGTSGGLAGQELGSLLVAGAALCEDGASRALGGGERAQADPELTAALERVAGPAVVVASADLFYDPDTGRPGRWRAAGAVAVEMEAATLFTVARLRGVAAGCVLIVSDRVPEGERIGDDELHAAELRLGEAALAALPPLGSKLPGLAPG
jgi:uridine phosphorylase